MEKQTQNSELKAQSYKSKEVAARAGRNQEQERNLKVAATIHSRILFPPFVILPRSLLFLFVFSPFRAFVDSLVWFLLARHTPSVACFRG
jgi:hypothetical protein